MWLEAASSARWITLPDHFWDGFGGAVLGAIVGGILTAVSGYLATRRIRTLDIRQAADREQRELQAAVTIVMDELRANEAVAHDLVRQPRVVEDTSTIGLTEASYLAVENSLVLGLQPNTRVAVANAYAEIRARDTLFDPGEYQPVGGGNKYARRPRERPLAALVASITGAITALEAEQRSWTVPRRRWWRRFTTGRTDRP